MTVKFHSREWHPAILFKDVSRSEFLAKDDAEREAYHANLWQGICSEFDASELKKKEILRRNLLTSDDARIYIDLWSRDERRHTEGFMLLIEILLGIPPEEVLSRLEAREHDFSLLDYKVTDEFSLLTVIAFDEIATCRGYSRDRGFYEDIGHPAFLQWIKETIADEVTHATNAVRVIHEHHKHRIREFDEIIKSWIEGANSHIHYRGTFLMDSLDLGYFRSDFSDFQANLKRLMTSPELLRHNDGKTVVF